MVAYHLTPKQSRKNYGILTFDNFREISRPVIFVILDQFKVKLGILEHFYFLKAL